jgi:transposase-like protein
MATKPKTYTMEDKRRALAEWSRTGSATAAAKSLGMSTQNLYAWKKQLGGQVRSTPIQTRRLISDSESAVIAENVELHMLVGALTLQLYRHGIQPAAVVHQAQQTRTPTPGPSIEAAVAAMNQPSANGSAAHFTQ